MNRFLAFAALVAGVLAGEGGFSLSSYPTYGAATSYAAPPVSTSITSTTTAAPSMITLSSVAHPLSTGMPSSSIATHTVLVGGTSLTYTPPSLTGVKDKDTIMFIFLQLNHTVTQSSFLNPCQKVTNAFASGFLPSNGSAVPFVLAEFSDPLSTGTPLWFYCGQSDHCELGMRFSINANTTQDTAWRAIDRTNSSSTATTSTTPSIVTGTGTLNNGVCTCDCLCGANAFPVGDGLGMMGGMPGMIPLASGPSMVGSSAAVAVPASSAAYGASSVAYGASSAAYGASSAAYGASSAAYGASSAAYGSPWK